MSRVTLLHDCCVVYSKLRAPIGPIILGQERFECSGNFVLSVWFLFFRKIMMIWLL